MFLLPKHESFRIFLLISVLIPIVAISISGLLAPVGKRPERITSYESGIEPTGDAWIQFRIRYYMFALVFVIFDVETVFLYPWATAFNDLGTPAFVEVPISVSVSIIGLVYAWRKGALEWS
uniref:NAD(P)H-quinone oxidoreductase subunit 3, chloroplastic n=1 Tax=Ophioglossum hongii TaxID=3238578 RepID=A0AB39U2P6_9MONI